MSLIILFSVFSTFFAAYFACFGEPNEDETIFVLDAIMESCFVVDLIKNFFLEYTDPREPRKPVRDLFLIARNYLKGAFIFDCIANIGWPLRYLFRDDMDPDDLSLIYLLRLLRLSKILILLDLQKFTQVVRNRYRNKLTTSVAN